MKKHFLPVGIVFLSLLFLSVFLSVLAFAGKVEGRGQEWLDAQKDPPQVNVNGEWNAKDWGVFHLKQDEGSRDVSGDGYGYDLTGVVSGKRLFLLFHHGGGSVAYCATLTSDDDKTLTGTYSYRVTRLRFGHGLCQEKGRPMQMTKR
ncbi:MAG TPA: hypothetical protein VFO39_06050 [Candidatus Sulfotelmatobacter sp.]|nr:hypothetical protein [Candidatus Sulfotelmatobacter sp.]